MVYTRQPVLVLHRANCSRRLVEALLHVLAERPAADPFAPEHIAVQSRGMERWLAMELSRRLGVWANPRFPFPRHVLEAAFEAVLGPAAGARAYDEPSLCLAIASQLGARLDDPAFADIARYLSADAGGDLRLQLSERIARVFDDYTAYRPEMLLSWEGGAEDDWQARLWRALAETHGPHHQAARAAAFIRALDDGRADLGGLPDRLCFFGVSTLPPLYVSVLDALARHVEIHLFVLSPSREFFGDLRRARAAPASDGLGVEHTLLASLGRQGRELQSLLEERAQYVEADADLYVDPGTGSLLAALQSDILHARARGGPDHPVRPIDPADGSLRIHACHGPMRELEVLHDQLLDAFERDPTLEPRDVIVMAPDIETYAPLVDAVFGVSGGRPHIPYSVSHRRTRATHDVLDALFALMEVLQGRLGAAGVLDLLAIDCVRERFDVAAEELDRLRGWVHDSGIRWGEDADHRAQVGQPRFEQNSWRFGLERLLLGYAMDDDTVFRDRLPHPAVEGSEAPLLGKLAEFCERLFAHRSHLAGVSPGQGGDTGGLAGTCSNAAGSPEAAGSEPPGTILEPRPLARWRDDLGALLDAFVATGPATDPQLAAIRAALSDLAERAEGAGFAEAVPPAGLLRLLEGLLDRTLPARGFLSGGVTFCQLVPMRSIPFRVVCLVGMDDDAFPGRTSRPSFDRMAQARQAGDRSRRDDDRYMFLEALLAARERLLLTYVGQGIHDNAVRPPSVVVAELLDVIARGFEPPPDAGAAARERRDRVEGHLVVKHRLHAFSPDYFREGGGGDPRLFSYARQFESGARALGGPRVAPGFMPNPLPALEPGAELQLEALETSIARPARALLRQRLGLVLDSETSPLAEREPIALDALERWSLGSRLMDLALQGHGGEATLPLLRASGRLPVGTPGQLLHEALWPGCRQLAEEVERARGGAPLPPLSVALELGDAYLVGTLRGLYPAAHLSASYSRLGRRFELTHWLRHLLLTCMRRRGLADGYPGRSLVIGRTEQGVGRVAFEAPEDPEALLRRLVQLARQAQRGRVPFALEASWAYAKALTDAGGTRPRALVEARKAFDDRFGDYATDAYVRTLFPEGFDELLSVAEPVGFEQAAMDLFGPFFDHRSPA